ncbi:abc transporter b family protein [Vairimorpha apis BRL 01]|uniref:Abc transporter b family protein n=1 Tax=Vairimorpha apis BRL 01 TaxID=1037528 RepID=T0L6D5_9MICR|nr:abc transporter b family protein [Vairimorpha apis BRL 01]
MDKKSNIGIIKQVIIRDMLQISYVRYILVPVLFTTILASYLEVNVSLMTKELSEKISKNLDQLNAIKFYVLFSFMSILLTEMSGFIYTGIVQYVFRTTSKSTFKTYINLNPKDFNKFGCGEIQMIIDRKSKACSELIQVIVINLLPIITRLAFIGFSIFDNLGKSSCAIIIMSVLFYISITIKIAIWRTNIRRKLNKSENNASNKLQDGLINHETIAVFKTSNLEVKKYDDLLKINEKYSNSLWRAMYILNFLQKFIFLIQHALVISIGIFINHMEISKLIFYISISNTLTNSLSNLGYLYSRYTQAILNAKSAYNENIVENQAEKKFSLSFNKNIIFKNVYFEYEKKAIFKNINFIIDKNEKIAIVGRNGSGKTTLFKIFLNFELYQGQIFIDNQESQNNHSHLISYIPQNVFLFNDTVIYNIKYGCENITDDVVFEICKKFGLYEFFSNLEHGFETKVGERGKLLSGGERQKILLMRSILNNKEILMLDESTSALDKESESKFLNMLLHDKRTIFMIIHNIELISLFDKILFINNKNIEIISKKNLLDGNYSHEFNKFILDAQHNKN